MHNLRCFIMTADFNFYMYDFMYVDSEEMPVDDHFSPTITFVENYRKIWTPGPVPKHWLGFSYMRS